MALHTTVYSRSRTVSSFLIRAIDGMGPWSHCAGLLEDGEHVIEAVAFKGGVVITPLADLIRRSSEVELVRRWVPDKAAGDAWARSTVGRPYDWLGAAGVRWGRDWEREDKFFCSEHDVLWRKHAGAPSYRPGTRGVSPNESYKAV